MDIILVAGNTTSKLAEALNMKNFNVVGEFKTLSEAYTAITMEDLIYFNKILILDAVLSAEDVDNIFDKCKILFTIGRCSDKEFIIIAKNPQTVQSFSIHFKDAPNFKLVKVDNYAFKTIEDALLGDTQEIQQEQQPQQEEPKKKKPLLFNRKAREEQSEESKKLSLINRESENEEEDSIKQQENQRKSNAISKRFSQPVECEEVQEQITEPSSPLKKDKFNRIKPTEQKPKDKGSLFGKKKSKNRDEDDYVDVNTLAEKLKRLSGRSVILGVTGLGGSGKTFLASNLAYALSCFNIKTCLIDLNIYSRGINLYYPELTENYYAETTNNFLYKALYRPSEANIYTFPINSMLNILAIPFGFDLTHNEVDRFNSQTIKSIIASIKPYYNVVIIDIPFNIIDNMQDLVLLIDKFLFITRDSLYGVSQIAGILDKHRIDDDTIRNIFISKLNYVLNYYTGENLYEKKSITRDNFLEILSENIDDSINVVGEVVGIIPYMPDLDKNQFTYNNILYKKDKTIINEILYNLSL